MFKKCPLCAHPWKTREAFLSDPGLEIIGYQSRFDEVESGLYLFNHVCQTTLALEVAAFEDLYKGPRYETPLTGSDECDGYCLDINALEACRADCKYAYVRDIIQIIKNWPKSRTRSGPALA